MTWSTPADLKSQLARRWERGDLLRPIVTGEASWPLRLVLKGPTSAELADRFEAVRTWVAELAAAPHIRIEWCEVRHRIHGQQRLPESVWVDTLGDALAWLGKRHDAARLTQVLELTGASAPALLPWLAKRPLQAVEMADPWSLLLAVVQWLIAHPRPGIYLRQVDIPGVHSKFIETHRAVLAQLLDLALPINAVDATKTGISEFTGRYGFLDKPPRIRFRVLDPGMESVRGAVCPDVALDADNFSRLDIGAQRVFITENETNFLVFPPVHGAIVVFGAGYGWEALARARWLDRCAMYYWGDIDTHGFAILDQLRVHFPQVDSFLMDRATLDAHRSAWGVEEKPARADLSRLTAEERTLYDDLRDNRIRPRLRLEQEHVGFRWLGDYLQHLIGDDSCSRSDT